jgi:hypothetical protein
MKLLKSEKSEEVVVRRLNAMKKVILICIFLTVLGLVTIANAELQNNGNDLIYDTDRNITWYNPNVSAMSWDQAMAWVEGLTVGGATGWRLPTAYNQDGSYPLYEYNVIGSELGHLYYVELGNAAYGPLMNTGPLINLQSGSYWSSSTTEPYAGNAFVFDFNTGRQAHADKTRLFNVLAVHPGSVGAPVPMVEVTIDIRPWSKRNPINYKKGHGILPVAMVSTEGFDPPSQVDQDSLTFGATGNEKSLAFCNHKPKDRKRGGLKDDLVCYFYIEAAGFNCGDTEGILTGKTLDGIAIEGKDLVKIIHCK